MITIELDLGKDQKLDNLTHYIKIKKIKIGEVGFQLKIHSYQDITQLLYAGFLLLLAKYFIEERNKRKYARKTENISADKLSKSYYELYIKSNDVNKLETKIEKDFNIDIVLEKKNPIDEVFGIWKNENTSIDTIREKAWQRTK